MRNIIGAFDEETEKKFDVFCDMIEKDLKLYSGFGFSKKMLLKRIIFMQIEEQKKFDRQLSEILQKIK